MAAEPLSIKDKDAALFIEGNGESTSGKAYSAEYTEYLRLENEVYVGQAKKKLLRKIDIRVVLPLVVSRLQIY